MASRQWNPAKRLRHLEAVSARNLTLGLGDQQAEAYFSLSFWEEKDSLCCPLYRSEGVCGTLNPEWMPLSWPLDLEPACQAEQVVLAIHQAPAAAAGQGSGELATARFFSQPRPSTTGTKDEATGNSRSLLVGQLTPPESEACDWQGQCRDANLSKQLSSSMEVEPTDPSQHAAAAEPQLDVGLEDDLAPPTAAAPQMSWSTQQRSQEALAFSDEQQDSNGFSFDVVQGNGQYGTGHSGEAHLAQGPASEDHLLEAKGKAASKQLKVVAATPGGPLSGEQGAAAGSAVVVACKALAASRPGAFPGEVIAAWLLDLNRLYFVGGDLASLKEALALDTVVLQLEDGLFVHPPPPEDAAAISLSQTASPTKRALTILASERLPTSSPTGSAPRRFANLLMSKLLRSTRSLQDTADRGGAESDSDHDDAASEASASTRFTSHTASREAAGVLLGGNAAPSASVAPTKALALSDMSLHITALCALRSSVLDLHSRAQALRRRLEELVAVRQQAKEQEQQLWQVQQGAQRSRQRMHRLQHRLGELQQELGGARKAATVRTQALVTTLKVMKAADRKLQDAQESMRGEEGLGRLVGLHSELVARRCLMTCQLGGIFQLGPVTVSVLEAPPGGYLEDRLEQQWVGRGSTQGRQEAPALKLLLPPDFRAWPANGTAALEAESAVHLRQEVHLSIGGIELRSAVWRAAFEDSAGMDITAAEDEAAAVALGYVAQLVDRLAEYLGVQLRYPLCLLGSKSSILEGYPPAGTWSAEEPVKRTLFGRSDASASSSTGTAGGEGSSVEPAEYPLHCQNRRERPKFAVGVFLLNKNITQLLQAHGITAGGPNHLLHNLYKLICAANSGLPQHQQRQQKRG